MKYAILLLLGVSAWAQMKEDPKPTCPKGQVAIADRMITTQPPTLAWDCVSELPQSSQNTPLASYNQSPTAKPLPPDECKAAGMAKGCVHWGPPSSTENPFVVTCEFGEHRSAKNCRIAEGHTLDDAVNAIINQCRLSVHHVKKKVFQQTRIDPSPKPIQWKLQAAKKKAVSKPK